MKAALLVQAHKNPEQVARMCARMEHPDIDIYVNIDLKSDIGPFRALMPRVRFVGRRTDIGWGGFSQVEATLEGLGEIAAAGIVYDYVMFVSGQDYPIAQPEAMLEELGRRNGAEYMSFIRLDPSKDRATWRKAVYYHPSAANTTMGVALRRIAYTLPLFGRRYPVDPIYKGSQWWTLTGRCVEYILRYVADNPGYAEFHRRTFCPDEIFFHNIVLHSPFAAAATGDSKRFIVWEDGSPNPKTLDETDYERIAASGAWFARKFDQAAAPAILDLLDARV